MGDMIEIDAPDGAGPFSAYRAQPAAPAAAAVIVIQEIFGVNAGIRRKADDWAASGYLALAPDMFWRFAPGYQADPDDPDQAAHAFDIRSRFDLDLGVADIEATIRAARAMLGGGKVGVVGFCMGGRVAYLAATRTDADASVSYYGAGIDRWLNEAHAIARPLLLHFAEEDSLIGPVARRSIHAALDVHPRITIHDYSGVGHGFADTYGRRRAEQAARLADDRTRTFFAEHLA
jgi:carboxymethylenebutenolidase